MNIREILLGTAAFAAMAGTAYAQDQSAPAPSDQPKHHHHHMAAGSGSDPNAELRAEVEQLKQEVEDLKAQQGNGNVSSAQFEALQNQVYETQATVKAASANQANVRFNHSHLTISSADGKYTFSPIADVMGDWASYSKSQPLATNISRPALNLKSSGENFRRAQIGFQGIIAGDFTYKFVYDFGGTNGDETYQAFSAPNGFASACAGGPATLCTSTGAGSGPHIKEAWVGYKGILDPFTLRVGAMPTPANLSDMTSSDDLLFLERPSAAQLSRGLDADDGRESVGFIGNGDWWQGSLFMTGDTYGKGGLVPSETRSVGGQEAVVGRAAIFPFLDPATNFNVHLGGNFGYVMHPTEATSNTGATTTPITFSDRPELRVDNITFLNAGGIDAHNAYSAGVELAASWGPFMVQGENFWFGIDRNAPAANVTNPHFDGWYVEGSWVLTGEYRKYNPSNAAYTRPSPADPFDPMHGGWGAWELAGRYSSTDLNYHTTAATAGDRVFGGKQDIMSAGINFYPNDTLKFMLDYQDVTLHNIAQLNNNGSYNTISFRGQVTF